MKQIVEDKSQLILTILAMILASFSIGQNITESSARQREREDMAQIIDAKVRAGMAEARAAMQEQVAAAKQTADAAKVDARVALSEVERANAELAAKGLIRKAEH